MAYQKQIWENLPSTNTPLNADRLNHMEDGIYEASTGTSIEVHNEYSTSTTEPYSANYVNTLNGEILWANPNPSTNFASQTITLNSGDYDFYEVIFRQSASIDRAFNSGKLLKGYGTLLNYHSAQAHYRLINYTTDTSLFVGDGVELLQYDSTTINNAQCVPLYIIGYKTGLFD